MGLVKLVIGCSLRLKQIILFDDLRQDALFRMPFAEESTDNILSLFSGRGFDRMMKVLTDCLEDLLSLTILLKDSLFLRAFR